MDYLLTYLFTYLWASYLPSYLWIIYIPTHGLSTYVPMAYLPTQGLFTYLLKYCLSDLLTYDRGYQNHIEGATYSHPKGLRPTQGVFGKLHRLT
jgi:hypothetical protein